MFSLDVQLVELLEGEPGLADLAGEHQVRLSAVVLHEVLEVVVPGREIFRVVPDVAAGAEAVPVGTVVPVFDHLEKSYLRLESHYGKLRASVKANLT